MLNKKTWSQECCLLPLPDLIISALMFQDKTFSFVGKEGYS